MAAVNHTMSMVEESVDFQYGKTRLIFYPLLVTTLVLWLVHRWQQSSRMYKLGNKIPGPTAIPFLGNALLGVGKSPDQLVEYCLNEAKKYGKVVRGWFGPQLVVFLADPDDAEIILNSKVHINKAPEYDYFKPWLGDGLLISSGDKWRTHRKMIAPTFHINILKSFVETFNVNSKNVVNKLKGEMGKIFDVHDHMSEVTVDILLETAMGITRKTLDESGYDYAMAVMKMCGILHQRHYKFWLRPEILFRLSSYYKLQNKLLDIIHGLTTKVIRSRVRSYFANKVNGIDEKRSVISDSKTDSILSNNDKSIADTVFKGYKDDLDFNDENDIGQKKRLAFLDLLLESGLNRVNDITDAEIQEEVDTIMFEGHDTTAAGSSHCLCILGVHQDIQARVYDELYEIFGDSDRPATFDDTLKMKYLERVILETLRMYPPVPIIARQLTEDVQLSSNNYILPGGTSVVIGIFQIHRDPKHWKNPTVFDPDNFLPENTAGRHYYSFVPFSAGPRSCVGRKYALLKLKVLLSTILRNYKFTSAVPEEEFKLQGDIILKRTDGFRVKIEPRVRVPSKKAA